MRELYRDMARAALAALPQPIGYAIVAYEPSGLPTHDLVMSDSLDAAMTEAKQLTAYWTRPHRPEGRNHTVVALVPVEDQ